MKVNAPTVQIILDREMQISGWVTPSHNEDNVGIWAACAVPVQRWKYHLIARLQLNKGEK